MVEDEGARSRLFFEHPDIVTYAAMFMRWESRATAAMSLNSLIVMYRSFGYGNMDHMATCYLKCLKARNNKFLSRSIKNGLVQVVELILPLRPENLYDMMILACRKSEEMVDTVFAANSIGYWRRNSRMWVWCMLSSYARKDGLKMLKHLHRIIQHELELQIPTRSIYKLIKVAIEQARLDIVEVVCSLSSEDTDDMLLYKRYLLKQAVENFANCTDYKERRMSIVKFLITTGYLVSIPSDYETGDDEDLMLLLTKTYEDQNQIEL